MSPITAPESFWRHLSEQAAVTRLRAAGQRAVAAGVDPARQFPRTPFMLVQARHENIGIFESQPAPVAAWAGALVRFCRTRLLELGVGALLVVLWLQVFGTWVSFLQEASLLSWPR